jgi:signal transduction histidine kinase
MISITRRLILTVVVLELISAIGLIAAFTVHERHLQLKAFDASLVATAESLMGAVQDAEDENDSVMLDIRGVQVVKDAAFRVEDERGRLLGTAGTTPQLDVPASSQRTFRNADIGGREYRFLVLHGLRIVDPAQPNGGILHPITIVYGAPVAHVWHEVLDAVRFFAIATAMLLGITALFMAWLVRKGLAPLHELAREADRISSSDWHFDAPLSSKNTRELLPLAAALEAALERVQRSFEQQRRFTNDAAHELKTEVAIVKSSLQLLSMRERTVAEYGRGLALSLADFSRLETTVHRMLTLARLESSPARNDSSENKIPACSLQEEVKNAVNQSKSYAELKAIEVNLDLKADAIVPLDSRDALLLCSNLLLNALQHSPEESYIRIEMTAQDGTTSLTILDEGEGVPDNDRHRLFEPFYRSDPSRSRESGGTGLGLAICKAICERAGGSIEIANRSKGGAQVVVKLPAVNLSAKQLVTSPSR